jgi:hypothetical protein
MTALCPAGHESADEEWCDQCGARIGGPVRSSTDLLTDPAAEAAQDDDHDTARSPAREPCPSCGAPRSGDDRYCEGCGYDLLAGLPVAAWEVVVSADRAWFEQYSDGEIAFPAAYGEWRVALDSEQVTIGRARAGSEALPPAIDLAGEHADPGISRAHAMLQRGPDGGYAVLDLGSMNGTSINDDPAPIAPRVRVQLEDGDRVRVGAWTTITLRRR